MTVRLVPIKELEVDDAELSKHATYLGKYSGSWHTWKLSKQWYGFCWYNGTWVSIQFDQRPPMGVYEVYRIEED